ncbi:type VII secretion protein EccE [Cryptosporangium phraense]|uniref:type VII secretion protein EccE n=1 Tax=Cryptosporangium phraense TaxID=2593070 RepID=UPI001F0F3ECC|nr:type VII secretion protein EccE [Cryptosporangium phraense]
MLALTAIRVRGRWTYEWLGLAARYSSRRRRWNARSDQGPALLSSVAPGARVGRLELDADETIGVLTHEAGLTAVLEVDPDIDGLLGDGSTPLPSPLSLLPMGEAGELPITAQAIVEVVPAPVDALAGTAVDLAYRDLFGTPPPARRQGWIAIQAVRTLDGPPTDVKELSAALTSALRRTQRRLAKAGFAAHVLDPEELAATIDELSFDRPDPDTGAPPNGAMAEEWAHWRTPTSAQTTLSVFGWPDLSDPDAALAFDRLADASGVPTALSLGIRRTDRGVEVEAVVRVAAASRRDVDQAVSALLAQAGTDRLRLRRLNGEQANGLAATLPLGGFLR